MKTKVFATLTSLAAAMAFTSCTGNPDMTRRTVGGAAVGAGAGAIIGNQTGNRSAGAAIGATAGGLLGNSRAYREEQRRREHAHELRLKGHRYY